MSGYEVRFPDITVELCGHDGNAWNIIARVTRALREAGIDEATRLEFTHEATVGDYDHLLTTCMRWVEVA